MNMHTASILFPEHNIDKYFTEKLLNGKLTKINKSKKEDVYCLPILLYINAYHMNWISDFPLSNSSSNVGISTHIKT